MFQQSFEFFRNPSRCFIEETDKLSAKIQGIPVGKPHLNKCGAVQKNEVLYRIVK